MIEVMTREHNRSDTEKKISVSAAELWRYRLCLYICYMFKQVPGSAMSHSVMIYLFAQLVRRDPRRRKKYISGGGLSLEGAALASNCFVTAS